MSEMSELKTPDWWQKNWRDSVFDRCKTESETRAKYTRKKTGIDSAQNASISDYFDAQNHEKNAGIALMRADEAMMQTRSKLIQMFNNYKEGKGLTVNVIRHGNEALWKPVYLNVYLWFLVEYGIVEYMDSIKIFELKKDDVEQRICNAFSKMQKGKMEEIA